MNKKKAIVQESLSQKLDAINKLVLEKLGKFKNDVIVIKSRNEFSKYIDECIKTGAIAIDTETNNSLDPFTCSIMGLCLFSDGQKQAYIPINHKDPITKEKLSWQLSKKDIEEELTKVKNSKVKVIMHNGKFDYEVIKHTCGIEIPPYWDTLIAAKLLNENEQSGLKHQYKSKFDKTLGENTIEKLFKGVCYAYVDPEIFALYAATDSFMTYKLYEYQRDEFKKPENIKIEKLFFEIEMPMVEIVAGMEAYGTRVDLDYQKKLVDKYNKKLLSIDQLILKELEILKPTIERWKSLPRAQVQEMIFPSEKVKKLDSFTEIYPATGERYKWGKKKCELIKDPINLSSPKQLSTLFYEVLDLPPVYSLKPTGTGKLELELLADNLQGMDDNAVFCIKNHDLLEKDFSGELKDLDENSFDDEEEEPEVLKEYKLQKEMKKFLKMASGVIYDSGIDAINEGRARIKSALRLCELLLERRETEKLITTYLSVIPALVDHWPDGKIRFQLNSIGARTGRFSSGGSWKFLKDDVPVTISGMNAQNIPNKNHEIRLLFKPDEERVFVGGDFSQQEPKLAAFLSQDKRMLETFKQGKDIYAVIAQSIFDNNYEDNLEFFDKEKKHVNLDGKERRAVGKVVILATMYGMGPSTLERQARRENDKLTKTGAQMLDDFFNDFAEVKTTIDGSQGICKIQGYIDTILGGCCRRRRLPNIRLPKYRARFIKKPDGLSIDDERRILEAYIGRANKYNNDFMPRDEFKLVQEEAKKNGVVIESNEIFIKKAQRQCFNSRIQGAAATLTKKTMILIYNDPILKELDANIVFQIHDEFILDCPKGNAKKVESRLMEIMTKSVNTLGITIGMKCDTVSENRWGEEPMTADLKKKYVELKDKKKVKDPLGELIKMFPNFPADSIIKVINNEVDVLQF